MRVLGVQRFALSDGPGFKFFDQVPWRHRGRTKFVIEFTSLLLEIEFNPKKTRSSKSLTMLINCFDMPANRIFSFIDAEYRLEGGCDRNRFLFIRQLDPAQYRIIITPFKRILPQLKYY